MLDARTRIAIVWKKPLHSCWYNVAVSTVSLIVRVIDCCLRLAPSTTQNGTPNDRLGFGWIIVVLASAIVTLTCVASCSDSKTEVFAVLATSWTADGQPLPGLQILENGKVRGQTDGTGILFLQIRGRVGQTITLSGVCPKGYNSSNRDRAITLQHLSGFNNDRIASGPEVSWRCSSILQTTALVIRAPTQPNLPIIVRGQHVGRTTVEGVGHLLLKEPAGSRLSVTLDTSQYPELIPQNPQRLFHIEERNTILIFDQRFTKEPRKKKRRKTEVTPKRHIPYRITD